MESISVSCGPILRARFSQMTIAQSPAVGSPRVGAKIIDGRAHARHLRDDLRVQASAFLAKFAAPPKLTVVLVGDDAASRLYVANKSKACRDVGIESVVIALPATTPLDSLLAVIEEQNRDPSVHGIL